MGIVPRDSNERFKMGSKLKGKSEAFFEKTTRFAASM